MTLLQLITAIELVADVFEPERVEEILKMDDGIEDELTVNVNKKIYDTQLALELLSALLYEKFELRKRISWDQWHKCFISDLKDHLPEYSYLFDDIEED